MKIIININTKKNLGTCLGTNYGYGQGQVRDTNNNENNIYLFLFNKYKKQFSVMQNVKEKQKIFIQSCMKDELFKKLSSEEQTQLYTKLLSVI